MTLPRVLSAVGRTLAVLGVVMLLFVAFQLWGTGLQQAQAQESLEDDLAERLRQVAAAGQGPLTAGSDPPETAGPRSTQPAGVTGTAASGAPEGATTRSERAADPGAGIVDPVAESPPPPAGEEAAPTPDGEEPAPMPDAEAAVPTTTGGVAPGDTGAASAAAEADGTGPTEETHSAAAAAPAPGPTAPASAPAPESLPEYPPAPNVVRHISEAASARSVARLLDPAVKEMLPLVYPDAGEALARIIIPSIDVDEIVVAGVDVDDLRRGPGHYSTTPLPGQPGNAAIAGHRTTYGAPFGRLAELNAGDTIIVETLQGRFVYRVLPGQPGMAGHALGFRIVAPTALEVLEDHGDSRLTLTTCHPKYTAENRMIVHAALVGDPVVRLPRPGEPIGAEHVQLARPEDSTPLQIGHESMGAESPAQQATPGTSAAPATATSADDAPETPRATDAGTATTAGGGDEPDDASGTEVPGGTGGAVGDAEASEEVSEEAASAATPEESPVMAVAPPSPPVDAAEPSTTPEIDAGTVTASDAPPAAAAGREPSAAPATAPSPVADDGFGQGLSGDRGGIVPAVLWGLAAAAIWTLGWLSGRSGSRLRAAAIAAAPFLVVLYMMFSYVDRALPAY